MFYHLFTIFHNFFHHFHHFFKKYDLFTIFHNFFHHFIPIYTIFPHPCRYTNPHRDSYGQSSYEHGITCRNILTDPEIHSQLKQNHADNPYYRQYYGFWYRNDIADVGNIRYYAYRNNLIMELCMAGAWISLALWMAMLVLMLKERHHLKVRI